MTTPPILSDETHLTIRILAGCGVLCALFYFIAQTEMKPREHLVTLKVQTSLPKP
jgi:hypothetical protein